MNISVKLALILWRVNPSSAKVCSKIQRCCSAGKEGLMAQPGGEQVQVQIKADEKELVGQFSNLVMFHHTAEEFTVHFIYVFPNVPQGKLVSSVIVSPGHAKRIMRALEENIRRYEKQFGPIRDVPEPTPVPNVGFVQ